MLKLRFVLLFCCCLFSLKSFATDIFVTSNADSGPGTLRQALTDAAANGSIEKDYIKFNLADLSEAGRTITITSQLPDVSSNLVIDGSTQPGNKFGVSDAKVKIFDHLVYPNNLSIFYSKGGDNIEIFGLWLQCDNKNYIDGAAMIHIIDFGNVQFGAPTKGNFLEQGSISINNGKVFSFQSNVCWTNITGDASTGGGNISIVSCDDVTLGGTADAGNIIAGPTTIYFSNPVTNKLLISFNKMGVNYDGTNAPYGFNLIDITRLTISGPYGNDGRSKNTPIQALIKNNIIADVYGFNLLQLTSLGGKITIQGNAFNTNFAGTLNFNQYSQSIAATAIAMNEGDAQIVVGGDDPSQKNVIAYCQDGFSYPVSSNFKITRNSIFCVGEVSFNGYAEVEKLPFVKIASISQTAIIGTATPGSDVELFVADCSCSVPGPKNYFKTIKSDSNGNWSYLGILDGYIMASATLSNVTGPFIGAKIDESKLVIKNYSCTAKGSITGLSYQYSSNFRWFDSQNKLVGTGVDLKEVDAGTYTLKINYGTTCELTRTYTIVDNSITVDLTKIKLTKPTCSKLGSITGVSVSSYSPQLSYQWVDQYGKVACSCTDSYFFNSGIYTFVVQNADGTCKQTFGPFDMTPIGGVSINQSAAVVTPTPCGQLKGAVTNIITTGTGALKYIWKNEQGQQVGTTKDLVNQPAGKYILQVTDDTNCGPVSSNPIEIFEINGIKLDETQVAITVANCNSNGTITGLIVNNATKYEWKDANNNTVGTSANLINVTGGDYYLIAYNTTCSKQTKTYHIKQENITFPDYSFSVSPSCFNTSTGAITVNTDAITKAYRWVNSTGVVAGNEAILANVLPGQYSLYLTNQNGCESFYKTYTINPLSVSPPTVNNIQLCGAGSAFIAVSNASTTTNYRLFDAINSTTPLDEQKGGKFKVDIETNRNFYVSQMNGNCESPRAELKVSVGITAVNIANVITPNGDSINDTWIIKGIENYPVAQVQLFNRYGQKVFESRGYTSPFDGNMNGNLLPTGTYYYIVNLNSGCNLLSGSLTIIR